MGPCAPTGVVGGRKHQDNLCLHSCMVSYPPAVRSSLTKRSQEFRQFPGRQGRFKTRTSGGRGVGGQGCRQPMRTFIRKLSVLGPGLPAIALAGVIYDQRERSRCDAQASGQELPELVRQAEEDRKKSSTVKNPGGFEKIVEEGKKLATIDSFEGFRLEIQKMVTPHFYISHSFLMGPEIENLKTNALYDFSTHVVLPGNQLLLARLGHGGVVDGRYHFALGDVAAGKLVVNMHPNSHRDSVQAEGEINGPDYSATLRFTRGPQLYVSYLQGITPSLALGGDSTFDFGEGGGMFSIGGKYSAKDWSAVAMLAQYGQICLLQYVRHVSPGRMSLVADCMVNAFTLDAQTVLGAEVNMKQSRFVTTVDSDFKVAAFLESKVVPNAVTLLLSAEMLHSKSQYKFGYGFQLSL